jgi:hypothetical protein
MAQTQDSRPSPMRLPHLIGEPKRFSHEVSDAQR